MLPSFSGTWVSFLNSMLPPIEVFAHTLGTGKDVVTTTITHTAISHSQYSQLIETRFKSTAEVVFYLNTRTQLFKRTLASAQAQLVNGTSNFSSEN